MSVLLSLQRAPYIFLSCFVRDLEAISVLIWFLPGGGPERKGGNRPRVLCRQRAESRAGFPRCPWPSCFPFLALDLLLCGFEEPSGRAGFSLEPGGSFVLFSHLGDGRVGVSPAAELKAQNTERKEKGMGWGEEGKQADNFLEG